MTKSDWLVWCGGVFYPTVSSFIEEVKNMGVARRIPKYLEGMVPGESKIFLAHQQANETLTKTDTALSSMKTWMRAKIMYFARMHRAGKITIAEIPEKFRVYIDDGLKHLDERNDSRIVFGFYTIQRIEYLFDKTPPEALKKLIEDGIITATQYNVMTEIRRKCGVRHVGTYVTKYEVVNEEEVRKLGIDMCQVSINGPLVTLNMPIRVDDALHGRKPCRGVTRITEAESKLLLAHILLGGMESL